MKRNIFLALLIFQVITLSAFCQEHRKDVTVRQDSASSDSTEYELIVLDHGFETWLLLQPQDQHSVDYYKIKNRIYTGEWNRRFMLPLRYGNLYESYIDYDPAVDYGLEFERRLYYYFKYFQLTNGVDLSPGAM